MRLEILSGWKDIANYLGKGVRTAQRYQREFGLPVHRPSRKTQGPVLATRSGLDAWVAGRLPGRPRSPIAAPIIPTFFSLKDRIEDMDELTKRIKRLRLETREMLSETLQRIHNKAKRERTKYKAD